MTTATPSLDKLAMISAYASRMGIFIKFQAVTSSDFIEAYDRLEKFIKGSDVDSEDVLFARESLKDGTYKSWMEFHFFTER